ncbi:MAG TPA: DUF3071 domain-containing protein [Candidatus Corynebacterium gallistercoris]|uniref:DUF3071 domain-containing protein n=1 Tax=Candidatus Corynebacterium gallistercoris TaxID=2838530 RepID=A0A9D1UQG3_9CORY|nr:DUF3071 domain-containing protein [Candidatus Corynebacterium gallistercoris]
MQELKFVAAESDASSLVLRAVDSEQDFFLPLTDELVSFVGDAAAGSTPSPVIAPASASNPQLEPVGEEEDTKLARPHRARIKLSPREIQDRIRHGASVAELAEEADTDESRIEPYAWPILQERSRIAELARSTYPVSTEGPNELTLWEVLATALAARGENLADASWDAYQNPSRKWVAAVRWDKELAGRTSAHVAEFLLELDQPGPSLAHPANSIAGDLVDPRFGQPVRSVTPVTTLPSREVAENEDGAPAPEQEAAPAPERDMEQTDEFLLHPRQDQERRGRKRKAVTPHWEDVLLGVRTNPKKKK